METIALKRRYDDLFRPNRFVPLFLIFYVLYVSGLRSWNTVTMVTLAVAVFWSLMNDEVTFVFLLISLHTAATLDYRWLDTAMLGRWIFLFIFTAKAFLPLFYRVKPIKYSALHYGIIVYGIIVLFSTVGAFVMSYSIYRTISLWWLIIALLFYLWRYMENRQKIITWFKIAVIVHTFFLVMGFFAQDYMEIFLSGNFRYEGVYCNPNMLGLSLLFYVPASYFLFVYERRNPTGRFMRRFYLFSFSIGILSLLISGSRSSLLGVLIGCMVALSLHYRNRFILVAAIAFLVLGAMYAFIQQAVTSQFFENVIVREDTLETMSGRSELWRKSYKLFKERTIIGWGYGTSEFVLATDGNRNLIDLSERWNLHTHSSFFRSLLETGILGTTMLVIFIFAVPLRIMNMERRIHSVELNMTLLTMTAIFVACILNSFLESWLFSVGSVATFLFWWVTMLIYKIDSEIDNYVEPGDTYRQPGLFLLEK